MKKTTVGKFEKFLKTKLFETGCGKHRIVNLEPNPKTETEMETVAEPE